MNADVEIWYLNVLIHSEYAMCSFGILITDS